MKQFRGGLTHRSVVSVRLLWVSFRLIQIIFYLVLAIQSLYADHIVGGNLEMIAKDKTPGNYTLRLVIFQNEELNVSANEPFSQGFMIYRTRDNQKMQYVIAEQKNYGQTSVVYFNDSCSQNRRLKTGKLVYEADVKLEPAQYDDPRGYYVVWIDCCRNANINNIVKPDRTGIVFQLRFPPLLRNGRPFLNSSPEFNDINGEYLCVNNPFQSIFDAQDKDGDELRYSLVTPLNSYTTNEDLTESDYRGMGSYPLVNWAADYNPTNAMHGSPGLRIDEQTGILKVTPSELGLFVFTVQVDEYRKGEWIGSSRRDYQYLVIDCPPIEPPQPKITVTGFPAGIASAKICYGQEAELVTDGQTDWVYQWQKNGRYIPKANSNKLKVSEPGRYNVEIAFKTTCGRSVESREVEIVVLGEKAAISATSQTVCEGKSTELSTVQSDGLQYVWLKDGQPLAGENSYRVTVTTGGQYQVQLKDVSGQCPASASEVFEVAQLAGPQAEIKANPLTAVACPGETVILSGTQETGLHYEWYKDETRIPGEMGAIIEVTEAGEYKVRISDANGCSKQSDSVNVTFDSLVEVSLEPLPDVCAGNGLVGLEGKPAGGIYSGPGVVNDTFDPESVGAGVYEISYSIAAGAGCVEGTATQSIRVQAPPKPFLPQHISKTTDLPVVLNGDVGGQYNYQWDPSAGLNSSAIAAPLANPDTTTTYTVKVTDAMGCWSESTVRVVVGKKLLIPDAFSPNGDGINDEWLLFGREKFPEMQVFVYDRWGSTVFYSNGYQVPWDGRYKGQKVPAGIYPYKIAGKEGKWHGTVTVLH